MGRVRSVVPLHCYIVPSFFILTFHLPYLSSPFTMTLYLDHCLFRLPGLTHALLHCFGTQILPGRVMFYPLICHLFKLCTSLLFTTWNYFQQTTLLNSNYSKTLLQSLLSCWSVNHLQIDCCCLRIEAKISPAKDILEPRSLDNFFPLTTIIELLTELRLLFCHYLSLEYNQLSKFRPCLSILELWFAAASKRLIH